jgi:hypothetical protein
MIKNLPENDKPALQINPDTISLQKQCWSQHADMFEIILVELPV